MHRTTIATRLLILGLASLAMALPASAAAAAAAPRVPVTHAAAFASAQHLAGQSAAALEDVSNGAVTIDRSRTSVGNYLNYGKFRKGVSFALFGTNTVDGEARTLWCVGNFVFVPGKSGRTSAIGNVTCPVS
jgi:hypothetical protein